MISFDGKSDALLRLYVLLNELSGSSHQSTCVLQSVSEIVTPFEWRKFNQDILPQVMDFTIRYYRLNPEKLKELKLVILEFYELASQIDLESFFFMKEKLQLASLERTSLMDEMDGLAKLFQQTLFESSEEIRCLYSLRSKILFKKINQYYGFFGVLFSRFSELTGHSKEDFAHEFTLILGGLPFVKRDVSLMLKTYLGLLTKR